MTLLHPINVRQGTTILLLTAYSVFCAAQTAPDAGSLQQQLERDRIPQLPRQVPPDKPAPVAPLQPGGVTVTVTRFDFVGNTLLSGDDLALVVTPWLNRPLDFVQLQLAATAVANAYRAAGWVVRAYLPEQDVAQGRVTIQIVEALFGRLHLEGETTRLPPRAVATRFEAAHAKGAPLNANALDRALLLTDDLPGISVAGALRPGAQDRETDLVLTLADEPLVLGEVGLDNTGARSTGKTRTTARVLLASPMRRGDQASVDAIHSQGNDYLRIGYILPMGNAGWRVGGNASRLDYTLVSSEFSALKAAGDATTAGLEASYPLIRSREQNLYLSLAYDQKRYDNRSTAGTTSHYDVQAFSLGLAGNLFDSLGGGGANSANLSLTSGQVDLDGSPNASADAATFQTHGSFAKLRYSVARQQVMTPVLSLLAAYSGQLASKNLDSSEKFYLGGAYGVRAYPANEAGGSEGQLLNLELRWKLPQGVTFTAFYDWGRVTENVNNAFAGEANPNRFSLKGHGLSLGWRANTGVAVQATWARRDGRNPNATATGLDQDGSLDKDRFWLSANLSF